MQFFGPATVCHSSVSGADSLTAANNVAKDESIYIADLQKGLRTTGTAQSSVCPAEVQLRSLSVACYQNRELNRQRLTDMQNTFAEFSHFKHQQFVTVA